VPVGYAFQYGTSSTNLRPHLEKYHKDDYLKLIRIKGWVNQLPSAKQAQEAQAAESATELTVGQARPPFTTEGLLNHIVNFIVANDQVRPLYFSSSSRLPTFLSFSQFMSSRVDNFAICYYSCVETLRRMLYHTGRKLVLRSLMPGTCGSVG
jgi:hypothetical protein